MRRFLRETWELLYSSLYCPTQLQQRMNELAPNANTSNTVALSALFSNGRFFIQYVLIAIGLSLPAFFLPSDSASPFPWWLLPSFLLMGYGVGSFFSPSGVLWCLPLLFLFIYGQNASIYGEAWRLSHDRIAPAFQSATQFLSILPIPSQWVFVVTFGSFTFALASSGIHLLINSQPWISLPSWITWVIICLLLFSYIGSLWRFVVGGLFGCVGIILYPFGAVLSGVVGGLIGGGFSTSGAITGGIVTGAIVGFIGGGLFTNLIRPKNANQRTENRSNVGDTSYFIGGGLTGAALTSVMAAPVAGVIAGLSVLTLLAFLTAAALLSFCLASTRIRWIGPVIAGLMIFIGVRNLGVQALLAIPVVFVSYYRFLPDYLVFALTSLLLSQPRIRKTFSKAIESLPPFRSEILWLPLPFYDRLLTSLFQNNAKLAHHALQQLQASSLPGFQQTLQRSLPYLVAAQCANVTTAVEIMSLFKLDHPVLPILIPSFYQIDSKNIEASKSAISKNSDITLLFPRLRQFANDLESAFQTSTIAIRERSLERLINQLNTLPAQLPGLGIKSNTIQSWKGVIERWQKTLELELVEQQKLSQGELLNPFQYGNPLRPDRFSVFKGRQTFADQLVRLILDRNRPTLVLYGSRRSGKTSFLLNLPRLLPSDLIPIYLDMQQASMTESEGDFCYGLVRAICRDASGQGLPFTLPQRVDFYTKPFPTLEDWLDTALPQLGDRRLLLNLDEFEKIGSAIQQGRLSDRLFDELRSLIQHYDRLGFLFSGVQTLDELGPHWSSYFISIVPMEMHYLEPPEAEDLLRNPDPEFALHYAPDVVETLLYLTRCQPYLLQLLGSALVTQANLIHTDLATADLLQAAIPAAFTNGEPYFANVWTEFTGTNWEEVIAGQKLLKALALGTSPSTDHYTQAARQRLRRYHVIEQIGDGEAIEIPLFQQWVQERAIL